MDQLLDAVDDKDLAGLVERRQLVEYDYWALQPVDEAAEAPFVALPPPIGLFDRRVASLPELEVALAEVDLRWRLDVVLALEDWIGAD